MLDGDLARIYLDLWASRPIVRYHLGEMMPRGESGAFMLELVFDDGSRRPYVAIWIARDRVPTQAMKPDLGGATLEELITLAHELGHWQSHDDGAYEPNTLREEHRAWDHAERLLRDRGFDAWDAFARERAHGLAEHARLGTPP